MAYIECGRHAVCQVIRDNKLPAVCGHVLNPLLFPSKGFGYGKLQVILTMNIDKLRKRTTVSSLVACNAGQQNHVSSGASGPSNFQISKISPENGNNHDSYMCEFERELQELFDEVKKLISIGKKDDAVDILLANFKVVKAEMSAGARSIEEAAVLDVVALGFMVAGDWKVLDSVLNMMNKVVENLNDDEPRLDLMLLHMGSMYSTLGKFEKSLVAYQRAVSIMESIYGENSVFLVTPFLGMAKVLGSIGKVTKAVKIYHRAITILESSRGTECKDLAVPLYGLGNLLVKEGKAEDAEAHFLRVLGIYTKLYGENDARVGIAMCSLAHVKRAKGNVDEAIHLYKNALLIMKKSNYVALDDDIMEKMRIDLAELLHSVGRGQEGREILEECLVITEKHKGKEHPSLVTHMVNLASSYSLSKNYVEAEHLLRRSLEIMTKKMRTDDQSITYPMLHLAVTLFHLNKKEEAEQLTQEVLHIREKAFGKDSLLVGEALDCLVSIQTSMNKDENELLELLKKILTIQEREFGYESEEVMVTLKKITFYLDKLGRRNEKLPLQRRLSLLRMKYKQKIHY